VSLGADLLSIYDDARRNLDDVATYNADGDYVEMLAAEEHGVSSASRSRTVVSTPATPDRPSASAAAAVQRGSSDVDERTCKRPLSVSSTSSSMSSTSSLPRHQRKKLATAVQPPPPLPGVDDASPGCTADVEAGCLSTVAELSPAAAAAPERRRASDDERPSASVSCACERQFAAARGDDDDDDDDDARVDGAGGSARTPSRRQYVDRVVAEIIDTERSYVDDLEQIIHVREVKVECP